MICSFILTKATYLYLPCLTFHEHLTQLIILSLCIVSIMTMDLLIPSFNGFHLTRLIVHTTSLYLIIVLFLLLYTQVFDKVQLLALYFSPCILSLCLPLSTRTLLYAIHLLTTYNNRCLLPLIKYMSYFTLCSHLRVMSTANMLKLSDNKTELMLVTSIRAMHLHSLPTTLTIGNARIPF